jgi:hypothetical protein
MLLHSLPLPESHCEFGSSPSRAHSAGRKSGLQTQLHVQSILGDGLATLANDLSLKNPADSQDYDDLSSH